MEKLLNEQEAAALLGLSTRTLYTLREKGRLGFVRLRSTGTSKKGIRYRSSDLERYVKGASAWTSPEARRGSKASKARRSRGGR